MTANKSPKKLGRDPDAPTNVAPQIIRTREELAALDPDTILGDSAGPYAAGEAVDAIYEDDDEGRDYLPAVVIAAGDQVRAARQTLEEA